MKKTYFTVLLAAIVLNLLLSERLMAQNSSRATQNVTFGVQLEHRAMVQARSASSAGTVNDGSANGVVAVGVYGEKPDRLTLGTESGRGMLCERNAQESLLAAGKGDAPLAQFEVRIERNNLQQKNGDNRLVFTVTE
jgi:hypothetical protein